MVCDISTSPLSNVALKIVANMDKEIWRPVKGYEGVYEVSNLGRVRRLWPISGHTRQLKLFLRSENGYVAVNLSRCNRSVIKSVHRLVAEAFIPNPNGLPQVNHKDENKTNNKVSNLEWCDCVYNNNYGTAPKRRSLAMANNPKTSCPIAQGDLNGNTIAIYPSISEAARSTGIAKVQIRHCVSGTPIKKRRSDGTIYEGYVPKTAGGYKWFLIKNDNER